MTAFTEPPELHLLAGSLSVDISILAFALAYFVIEMQKHHIEIPFTNEAAWAFTSGVLLLVIGAGAMIIGMLQIVIRDAKRVM